MKGNHPRIEVIKAGQVTPFLPYAPLLSSSTVRWNEIVFEKHITEAIDVPLHEHPTNFLQLQTNGPVGLEWKSQGRWQHKQMEPNSMMLLPQGTQDEVRWAGRLERILISINQSIIDAATREIVPGGKVELIEQWGFHDPHLLHIIFALQADLIDGSPAGKIYGEALCTALIVYLQQRYSVKPVDLKTYRGGMPKNRLNRVLEFIAEHGTEDLPLTKLAEIAGMSTHYFSELFRQSVGVSPHQYLLQQRIDRAKTLLQETALPLAEISLMSGFQDQSHFTKVFRKLVGTTPSRYRTQI